MISSAYFVGGLITYLVSFWYAYILIMGLYRAHLAGRLTGLAKWLAYPAVIVGWLMDWFANVFIASIIFGELPQSFSELVTQRLTRYKNGNYGLNSIRAEWICVNLLDVFDPTGTHCK